MDENYNNYNRPRSQTGLIIALAVAGVAIVLLVGALIVGTILNVNGSVSWWGVTSGYAYSQSDSYTAVSEFEVDPSEISHIDVEWISGNITVMVGDGNMIKVTEIISSTDPDDVMRYRVHDKKLVIKFRKSGRFIATRTRPKDLIIEIPAYVAESDDFMSMLGLDIEAVSADIDINTSGDAATIHFRSVDIDAVSGHVCVQDVATDKVDIESVSGDILVSGGITDLDIDTVSGDVFVDLKISPADLDVDTVSGNVEIALPAKPKVIDVDTVSGAINIDGVSAKRNVHSEYHDADNKGDVDIDTVSGDVTVTTER